MRFQKAQMRIISKSYWLHKLYFSIIRNARLKQSFRSLVKTADEIYLRENNTYIWFERKLKTVK